VHLLVLRQTLDRIQVTGSASSMERQHLSLVVLAFTRFAFCSTTKKHQTTSKWPELAPSEEASNGVEPSSLLVRVLIGILIFFHQTTSHIWLTFAGHEAQCWVSLSSL
jgi:hypothetical protein